MRVKLKLFLAILGVSVYGIAGQAPVNDTPAKILNSKPFEMSKEAERAGIDGTLILEVAVDKSGDVKKVEIIAGPEWPCGTEPKKELADLRRAVKEIVSGAKFSPSIKDGKAQAADLQMKFIVGKAYQAEIQKREREEAQRKGIAAPISVKGGVLNGRALSLPRPEYNAVAKSQRIYGAVSIAVQIDEKGDVVRAGVLKGHPVLQESARNAACSAKFSPTKLEGQPVRVSGVITYKFGP